MCTEFVRLPNGDVKTRNLLFILFLNVVDMYGLMQFTYLLTYILCLLKLKFVLLLYRSGVFDALLRKYMYLCFFLF